ncbi:MAG: hypothetical protein JST92_15995 [Deltaproteobacteria bacterium]|nr:hypothetical protein [Deltaproteobacteria bacterium]
MVLVPVFALLALAIAAVSLTRLSRLPQKLPPVEERTFTSLRAGDVVLTPSGDFLVLAAGAVDDATLLELQNGRELKFLLAGKAGPVALLAERPESGQVERALGRGGQRLDRSTVELLPGA